MRSHPEKECFDKKDFLNNRYHDRKCLYLAALAKSVASSSAWATDVNATNGRDAKKQKTMKMKMKHEVESVRVYAQFMHGDLGKPCLVIVPPLAYREEGKDAEEDHENDEGEEEEDEKEKEEKKKKAEKKKKKKADKKEAKEKKDEQDNPDFVIRVLPVISADTFELNKLRPSRNNLRRRNFGHVHLPPPPPSSSSSSSSSSPSPPATATATATARAIQLSGEPGDDGPTPLYNNSVLEDVDGGAALPMGPHAHLRELHSAAASCPSFSGCCQLLKVSE